MCNLECAGAKANHHIPTADNKSLIYAIHYLSSENDYQVEGGKNTCRATGKDVELQELGLNIGKRQN